METAHYLGGVRGAGTDAIPSEHTLDSFIYATKSAETKRQYLIRLHYFFDYLKIPGDNIQEQAARFLVQAQSDHQWAYD